MADRKPSERVEPARCSGRWRRDRRWVQAHLPDRRLRSEPMNQQNEHDVSARSAAVNVDLGGIPETMLWTLHNRAREAKPLVKRARETSGEASVLKRAKQIIPCQKRQCRGRGIVIRATGF